MDTSENLSRQVANLHVREMSPLLSPVELKQRLPLTPAAAATVTAARDAIRRVIRGEDRRLLVVIGPCSIHDTEAALDYARRLHAAQAELGDQLVIVMRAYLEKPRTTVGWRGLINDPYLDGTFDMSAGLTTARRLLLELNELGLPVATEMLDPISPQYLDDQISLATIGARTTEAQTHRALASGISMPVGFKNGTDGGIKVASDAIQAAQASHAFMGMTKMGQAAIFETRGNDDCHVILRGGKATNYARADVDAACALLKAAGLREQVMIDVSHANSSKQHLRQIAVAAEVAAQVAAGDTRITGVMIESHLKEGRQDIEPGRPLQHGVSVTDACISFDQTVPVLDGLAAAVQLRRNHANPPACG